MEAVASFHLLDEPQRSAQRKPLEDVEGMNSVPPSFPFLRGNRRRHGNSDVAGPRAGGLPGEWCLSVKILGVAAKRRRHAGEGNEGLWEADVGVWKDRIPSLDDWSR